MFCAGGSQNQTSSPKSRLDRAPLTWPATASARYQRDVTLTKPFSLRLLFFIPLTGFIFQLRNSLRFLLGNLQGFDQRTQAVDPQQMYYIDQYMLHLLREYSMKVCWGRTLLDILLPYQWLVVILSGLGARSFVQITDAYSEFDAGRVIRILQAFISRDLSSFYFSIIKDRWLITFHNNTTAHFHFSILGSFLDSSFVQAVLQSGGLVGQAIMSDCFRGNSGWRDSICCSYPASPSRRGLPPHSRTRQYVSMAS